MNEIHEKIITCNDKPMYRVAFPEEFAGRQFLVIQKKHFHDKEGVLQWRGGVWIGIEDEDDIAFRVEGIITAIRHVLEDAGWYDQGDEQ